MMFNYKTKTNLCFLMIIFGIFGSSNTKEFRSDYTYNKHTDAFYKFHIESEWNKGAQDACLLEGSSLMMVTSEEDLSMAQGMFKRYPDINGFAWIETDGKLHDSAEDESSPIRYGDGWGATYFVRRQNNYPLVFNNSNKKCNVMTRDGEVQTESCVEYHPFVCKVDAKDVPYDSRCLVYANGYQYFPDVKSCYKIPRFAYSWNEAYSYCAAEGAHLAVLNSELEHKVVENITKLAKNVENSVAPWFLYVGVRAEKPSDGSSAVFRTIFNKTLEESGFDEWCPNEPNNSAGNEYCGTILRSNGKYNDVDCSKPYGFICEKEV